jgi:hypothetical protein
MKYKIGDRVRVRKLEALLRELNCGSYGDICMRGGCYLVKGMQKYCGKVVTIADLTSHSPLELKDIL